MGLKWFDYYINRVWGGAKVEVNKTARTQSTKFAGFGASASSEIASVKLEAGTAKLQGPALGGSLGLTLGTENQLAAEVNPSLGKAEASLMLFKNFGLYGHVQASAYSGIKLNREGIRVGWMGCAINLGCGGKWTIDTPFWGGGFATPGTNMHTIANAIGNSNRDLQYAE